MLLAWIISAMQPRRYRASVLAAVSPIADALTPTDVLRGVEVLEQRTVIATMAALAMTDGVIRQASQGGDADDVSVNAAVLPNTNLVRVDVDAPDAARATAVAGRIPPLLGAQARAMYKLYGVTTISAPAEADAVTPRSERAIIGGLLIGLITGALIAWAMDRTPSAAPAA
jgi:capsular polysaccharide biosynthesis protein